MDTLAEGTDTSRSSTHNSVIIPLLPDKIEYMTPINEQEINEIVRRVVEKSVGLKTFITVPATTATAEKQIHLPATAVVLQSAPEKSIAIGSDHGGFDMKEKLIKHLSEKGYQVTDCGPNDANSVDYPDFAHAVARMVSNHQVWRGIMIDGAGIGSCMTANKVPGVRAAMCYDYATAVNSREHNDANLLTLGAGLIGQNQAVLIVDTWLKTEFGGGRHAKRVDKIMDVEKLYLKGGR